MNVRGLYFRIIIAALSLLSLASCDDPVTWGRDIKTYVEDGMSAVLLRDYTLYDSGGTVRTAAPSSETNRVNLSLVNPRSVSLNGTITCDKAGLLSGGPTLTASSGITSELSFSFTPDLTAEHNNLSFTISLAAPSTGATYTLDTVTVLCNTVPGSMSGRVLADTDAGNTAYAAFALPEGSTDDDLSAVTISWTNLGNSSDSGSVTLDSDDAAITTAITNDTGDDLVSGYDSALRRYYQPGSFSAGDDYQFIVSVKDSGGLTSESGIAASSANYFLVSYDDNSADSGTAPSDQYYAQGKDVTVSGNTGSLVRAGYVFTEWNTAYDGSGTSYSAGDVFTMGSADITLYAQWDAIYSVTYDDNSADGGAAPADGNDYFENDAVTVLGNTGPLYRSGYAFVGWNTAAGGGGTAYSGGDSFAMGTADVTLYAQWDEIVAVAAGSEHSLILTDGGLVFGAGSNAGGQLGLGTTGQESAFTLIDTYAGGAMPLIDQIYAGYDCSFLVDTGGSLYAAGDNGSGQLGLGATASASIAQFTLVTSLTDAVTKVAVGSNFAFAITDDGTDAKLYSTGNNACGQLGLGSTTPCSTFTQVTGFSDGSTIDTTPSTDIDDVEAGDFHALILDGNDDLYACGDNSYYQSGIDPAAAYSAGLYTVPTVTSLTGVVEIAAGANHSRAMSHPSTFSYAIWGSGYNADAQAGIDVSSNISNCIQGFTQYGTSSAKYLMFAANNHTFDLSTSSDTLYAFGASDNYSIVSGSTVTYTITSIATDVDDVGAGAEHTLIINSSGLWGVGRNSEGELGLGTAGTAETSFVEILVE